MVKANKIPKVSIIILSYNACNLTKEQLVDVSKLKIRGFTAECIVVDNGSTDNTQAVFERYSLSNMDFVYVKNVNNLGFAGGNNVGIKYALDRGSDYVLLINNDLILPSDFLLKMMEYVAKNTNAQIVSPKMYFAKGFEFHKERYKKNELGKVIWYAGGRIDWDNIYSIHRGVDEVDIGQYDKIEETEFGNGACLLVRNDVFEKVGFLNENLFLYWEDAEFCTRAKFTGVKTVYFPDAYIWHKVSVSTGGSGGESNDYFLTRNRYFFAQKFAKSRTMFAVFRDTVKLVFVGRPWQRRGALDALMGVKGLGSWRKH